MLIKIIFEDNNCCQSRSLFPRRYADPNQLTVAASFATEWLFSGMRFKSCHKNVLLHHVQLNGFSPM